jgi:tight adherence protein B
LSNCAPAGRRSVWRCSLLLNIVSYVAVFGSLALITLVAVRAATNYRRRFIVRTEEKVEELYLGVSPERVWLWTLLGAAGGALVVAVVSDFKPVLVLLGAISGFLIPRFYLGSLEKRRRNRFDAQLVEAVTMIAGAMKAGMSLMQAIEKVTREMGPPIRQEFAYALQENRVGKPIIQALQDMKNRIRSEDLSITVNAISIAQETGGVLSDVLLKIAETIKGRNRIRGKINSLTAQGRLQGIIMALLPWGLAGILFMLDPEMIRPMFTTTMGQVMVGVICVLELAGWLVIRRLAAVDV